MGAQGNTDLRVFVPSSSTKELCVALIKSPGLSEFRSLFCLTHTQR